MGVFKKIVSVVVALVFNHDITISMNDKGQSKVFRFLDFNIICQFLAAAHEESQSQPHPTKKALKEIASQTMWQPVSRAVEAGGNSVNDAYFIKKTLEMFLREAEHVHRFYPAMVKTRRRKRASSSRRRTRTRICRTNRQQSRFRF